MIDIHVYSLPPELCEVTELNRDEASVLEALHFHPEGPYALSLCSPEAIYGSMNRAGIDSSALVSIPWRNEELCVRNNDHVLLAAESERFYAICAIQSKSAIWLNEAERVQRAGAIGLKINTGWQGGKLNSAHVYDVAAYVAENDMFLMVHVDHGFKQSRTGAAELYELAQRCPETRIIAAHLGGLLGIYALHQPVAEILQNVWFDTAVSGTLEMVRYYIQVGLRDKVLMGSDFPFNHSHSQKQVVDGLRALELNEEDWFALVRDNAMRLFGKRARDNR